MPESALSFLAIFLKFIFNQKRARFYLCQNIRLFFKNVRFFIHKKGVAAWKELFLNFKIIKITFNFLAKSLKNKLELFCRYFSIVFLTFLEHLFKEKTFKWLLPLIAIERYHKKMKILHSKLFQGEYIFPDESTYLLVSKYWESSYF